MKIQKIGGSMNVAPLAWALQENPHLWNQQSMRTTDEKSPHYGLDDIWVRYAAPEVASAPGPHESVWYPVADILPVKDLIYPLMQFVEGDRLGGVLITRIPPGKMCRPHEDHGWHARAYEKYGIQIASAPGQKFCFEGEELETKPGDVFTFNNAYSHWVTNDTPYERITMIVCIQTEKGIAKCRGE